MENVCDVCKGVGLVSTGAVPHDLSVGSKVVCKACGGTGKPSGHSASVSSPDSGDNAESPKAQAPSPDQAGGEGAGMPLKIVPQVGDACLTADDQPGTLQKNEHGAWVCMPHPPTPA